MSQDWTHAQWHPFLKPQDWKGAEHAICHPLLATAQDVPEMPWVALCRDLPEQFIFPPAEEVDGLTLKQLGPLALTNMAQTKVEWAIQHAGEVPLLVGKGPYAAEQLLDPALPAFALQKLGVSKVVAAAPRRGILLIRPSEGPGLDAFQAWIAHLFYAEAHQPVMPFGLILGEAGIHGVLRDEQLLALGRDRAQSGASKRLVQVVGYQAATQTLFLSCAPAPGQGLPPEDLDWMQRIVDEGVFQGRPVLQLRMTLPSVGLAQLIAPHVQELPISLEAVGPDGKLVPVGI
ncbi:MAG: hypothetical protein VX899_15515 [Myxococcota bacterium]|nr:hypothetical protein [Myxococcota bacterium]